MDRRTWISLMLGVSCGTGPVLAWRNAAADARPAVVPVVGVTPARGAASMEVPLHAESAATRVVVQEDPASLEELRARLAEVSGSGRQLAVLRKLVGLGTPEALDLLFEKLFEDPDVYGAESIWGLVQGVDDPRVFQLARMQFERALAEGLSGSRHVDGYLRLIASHGRAEGADLVLAQVFADGRVRSGDAARVIGYLKDHSDGAAYLVALEDPNGSNARAIGKGLANWNDPYVNEGLLALGGAPDVDEMLRHSIMQSLGYTARSTADVAGVLAQYWSLGDDDAHGTDANGIMVAMGGLRGLEENPWIDRDVVLRSVSEVLTHILTTEHWRQGVAFIGTYADWRTPETKLALEALLATLEDPADRSRVSAELLAFP